MTATYPTIRNSNYQTLDDPLSKAVVSALRLADQGCVDCDLLGALDDLETTLADHAGSDSEFATAACLYAEDAVAAAVDAMDHSFTKGA
jgi:hypothetical protein